MFINILILITLSITTFAYEDESNQDFESKLELITPLLNDLDKSNFPTSTDLVTQIELQAPVRSQGKRGVCTMFTTVGMIEHLLIKNGLANKNEVDLSEEWMEYVMMTRKTTEGSNTSRNFREVLKHGIVKEKTWPYIGMKWLSLEENPESKQWCEHLIDSPDKLASCLLGHRDPSLLRLKEKFLAQRDAEFLSIRNEARSFRDTILVKLFPYQKTYKLKSLSTVKEMLSEGKPLIMGLKLFYGAWNSKKTETFEIQKRNKDKWYQGIVTYPEIGTRDRRISGVEGGGHSLIIIGYDDEKIIKSKMLMEDGTWKEFSYKGVYYFKNSWGVKGSGKKFKYNGVNYPGYGMITQKYAHEFGNFYRWN
jgi:C1A family cysteine protease